MNPDMAMCRNDKCPKKETCYRYIAKPNPYWQTYMDFNGKDCYIECKSKGQKKRLDIQCEGEQ
jgi:hypothetical protein